eukprot:m.99524 g.99524  ORF g.99524 m.99524 type:complete len:1279 (+) comp27166_c2_seq1:329-4165(+)
MMATSNSEPPVSTFTPTGLPTPKSGSKTVIPDKIPPLGRKAWVMLKSKKGTAIYFKLCFAELCGTHLTLSDVKGGNAVSSDADFEPMLSMDIASFSYFTEDNNRMRMYFIEVQGRTGEPICFMTKNQADLTMKSSEMDYLNWQRMLAASMNIHLLEQKQYLLNADALPQDAWEPLGKGSFGQVFKAKMNGITPVAVKHVSISDVMAPGYPDEKLHVDFINEALISCTIQGPCLLHFYGIFWDQPDANSIDSHVLEYYMVSELCEGGDLRRLLYDVDDLGNMYDAKPRLPDATMAQILRELFSGLTYMHQRNVVHRDIKPDNIVLVRPISQLGQVHNGVVKIIDYGHSRTMPEATKLQPGILTANDRGTELYRAPETIATRSRSAEYSTKVDIYAMGVICWEMWTRELPYNFELKESQQRLSVEQLVASGVRPVVPEKCPSGYVSLFSWCWESDPKARPTAMQALECIITADAFDVMPCNTPPQVFAAVATGYWKRDQGLSNEITESMNIFRLMEDVTMDNLDLECIPRFVELINQNLLSEKDVLLPLEATVLAVQLSGETASNVIDVLQQCNGAAVIVKLLRRGCDSVDVCKMGLRLASLMSRRNPSYHGWSNILPALEELMYTHPNVVELQTLAIKFLSNVCIDKTHGSNICNTVLTQYVVDAVGRFIHCKELLAAAARFLTLLPESPQTQQILRLALPAVVRVIEQHIDDMPLQTLWLRLLSNLCTNPLSCIEVVKVKALSALTDAIKIHHRERAFCISALKLLQKITFEPSHAIQAANLNAIGYIFDAMHEFEGDAEVTLLGLTVLTHMSQVQLLRRPLLDAGASTLFFKIIIQLSGPNHSQVLKEAFRMANGIAENPKLIPLLIPIDQCEKVLQSIEALLHLEQLEPLPQGIELMCLMLESEEHYKMAVHLGGPRVLAYALRISRYDKIPRILLTTLRTLCKDKECCEQVVTAKGITHAVHALRIADHCEVHHEITQVLLEIAQHPRMCSEIANTDPFGIFAKILRREATNIPLIEALMELIATIVQTHECSAQFQSHNLRRIMQSIMNCFQINTKIQQFGREAFRVVYGNDNAGLSLNLPKKENDLQFKVIMVGDTGVGKTCIVLRACKNIFSTKVKATLGVNIDFAEIQLAPSSATLQIYDTAGQEQYQAMTTQFYRGCHAALLVYDVNRTSTFENLAMWLAEVRKHADDKVIINVVGSKCDLNGNDVRLRAERWAHKIGAQHHLVSAVANLGIHQMFRFLTERLVLAYPKGVLQKGEKLGESEGEHCSGCT